MRSIALLLVVLLVAVQLPSQNINLKHPEDRSTGSKFRQPTP
jgi:hypothetical protein